MRLTVAAVAVLECGLGIFLVDTYLLTVGSAGLKSCENRIIEPLAAGLSIVISAASIPVIDS